MTVDAAGAHRELDAPDAEVFVVPGSSANLGPGFDALGMALTVHAHASLAPFEGSVVPDEHHPAMVAFRTAGGRGDLHLRSSIPMGKGLGFSGAVRVAGVAAALSRQGGLDRAEILSRAAALEGHADNVAASVHGGVVATIDGVAVRVPVALDPEVLVWVPDVRTSTDSSRARLPATVSFADAVHTLGCATILVAALAAGDVPALRVGCRDRLHQPTRLAAVPASAQAIEAAMSAGAWAAWLSGSGPSVAVMCSAGDVKRIGAALPGSGHVKHVRIDAAGLRVIEARSTE